MASKATPEAYVYVEMGYDAKFMVPLALVGDLVNIIHKCKGLRREYLSGSINLLVQSGPVRMDIQMLRMSDLVIDGTVVAADTIKEYVQAYNSTHALKGSSDGDIVLTFEDFLAAQPTAT